tara:strand:+ start:10684 stop:12336 length:1653 start_codon:yes stop_codon:yes gene_type:complete
MSGFGAAESLPPLSRIHQQTGTQSEFSYPDITHSEEDAIVNDIVFFYPSEMLEFYDNDVEELIKYVEDAVELNNHAFKRQDIPLRRKIAGIVPMPSDFNYNVEGTRSSRMNDLRRLYYSDTYNFDYFHDTSYIVAITPYREESVESIGSGEVGGRFSWITPFVRGQKERTLAHELGHNDGFTHDKESYDAADEIAKNSYLGAYAAGFKCGTHSSIMKSGDGDRDEAFFSSPLVTNPQGEDCGHYDEGDSARAYKDAVANLIYNPDISARKSFKNNEPSKAATGTATLTLPSNIVSEGSDIIIEVLWSGAELGDSVQVVTKKGTAGVDDFKSTIKSVYFDGTNSITRTSIPTIQDDEFEVDETLTIELVYPYGVSVSGETSQEVIITSEEQGNAGIVQFDKSSLTIDEGQVATFTLQRTGGTDGQFTVNLSTKAGSADESDFNATDRDITFNEGETTKTVSISTINDSIEENAETFSLLLTGSSELIGSLNEATVTITANDASTGGGSNGGGNNGGGSNAGGDDSGGGSMGVFAGLFILGAAVARRKTLSK